MSDQAVFFVGGKRPRGRPRTSDEPMTRIDVRLPVRDYDRIIAVALERKESVASVTRALLTGKFVGKI